MVRNLPMMPSEESRLTAIAVTELPYPAVIKTIRARHSRCRRCVRRPQARAGRGLLHRLSPRPAEASPYLDPFDPEALAEQCCHIDRDLACELGRLERLRGEHLSELESLGEGWLSLAGSGCT